MFMKVYVTEEVHAEIVWCDVDTFQRWLWLIVGTIAQLKERLVSGCGWKIRQYTGGRLICFFLV